MKKSSTLKQDKPENNTSKYNQHLVNLSLPKQNYTKLSKIYLNPLFDTYITKSCLTNIKMNPTAITTHSTMSATNHQCYHHHTHQHHDNHYNPYHINTQFNSNYANDCECNYNNSIQYSTSRSIHSYHKNLSIPSIIDLITNYSTIQTTSILCNPVITYTNKSLAKESILPCQTEQHHAIDAYNTNHHLNLLTNRINNFKLISTSTELTMTTMNTMTSHSALHSNSYNLPLHDYNQSNYVTYSNVDSDIHNLSLITKLPHKNTNAAFNWNNTDHIKNIHDQLNCYHYSTFNKTNDMKHLPCNSLTWSYSNNCYHSTNTLPLLSLQNNDYYNDHYHHHQYAVHNHKHHDALQMNQYNNDSNNSVKQLDIDSLTNTSDSCYPIQSDMTT
ncbi:hypothetical protein MN116_000681 [Schistosoma mekongi]|uniref:Uncharacterized protein n=1 Tax=Schistosoma mekongi TaxID=38744 RepID=A0AAE1ZMA5_SCHME|nr:hypothetical protein MN116_000681 [Schistosoma mekongi]